VAHLLSDGREERGACVSVGRGTIMEMSKREHGLLTEIESDVLDARKALADALRKCVVLGGRAGSVDMREWASRELRGYHGDESLPSYRVIGAPLTINGFAGNAMIKGERMSVTSLPEFAQEHIRDEVPLRMGIAEIEAMVAKAQSSGDNVWLSPPGAAEIVKYMNGTTQGPYQQISEMYWSVSPVALHGVVDQVRTTLAELVAELRAGMPDSDDTPSAALADQAVSVAVHGKRSRVNVHTAQATSGSASAVQSLPTHDDAGFWTTSRRVGAFFVGAAGIIAAFVGVAQWQNWNPF
jgi:hypothetical protein